MMKNLTAEIERLTAEATAWFLQQEETFLSARPAPGKWSKKEIIGHLCDSAFNNIQRFVRAQYENNPLINYEQDNWVSISDYNSCKKEEIISLWKNLNAHLCRILAKMPPENYSRTCIMMSMANETKTFTLQWIAEDYVRHMQHHLHRVRQ